MRQIKDVFLVLLQTRRYTPQRVPEMQEYTVGSLTEDRLESAYFLIRSIYPDISLADWLCLGRGLIESGGILELNSRDGMPFGMLAYRRLPMKPGLALSIELLIVMELVRNGKGRRQLLDSLARVAEDTGGLAIVGPVGNDNGPAGTGTSAAAIPLAKV